MVFDSRVAGFQSAQSHCDSRMCASVDDDISPSEASTSAIALPIPFVKPVTSAVLSVNFKSIFFSFSHSSLLVGDDFFNILWQVLQLSGEKLRIGFDGFILVKRQPAHAFLPVGVKCCDVPRLHQVVVRA